MIKAPSYSIFSTGMIIMNGTKRISIPSTDKRFEKAKEYIKDQKWEELIEFIDIEKTYERYSLKLINGLLHYEVGGEMYPLPNELSERIVAYKNEGLSLTSLIAFWEKLKKNPSMNSVRQLFKFLENNGHPFTEDGDFIAYKTVRPDYMDWHSNSKDNSIGKIVEMPRNMVADDPKQTCSAGLHACSWHYLAHFHAEKERKIISLKINPADVVSVPDDYKNTKMRVSRYEVLEEVEADFKDILLYEATKQASSNLYEEEEEEEDYCSQCENEKENCDCTECSDCYETYSNADGHSCEEEPEEEENEELEEEEEELIEGQEELDCVNCGECLDECECPDETHIPPIPQS